MISFAAQSYSMVKKKKAASKSAKTIKKSTSQASFLGLNRAQTQSLAIGIVIVGIGLFVLAGMTWKNKEKLQPSIFPTAAMTRVSPTIMAKGPSQMISATSTAKLTEKQPLVKKLPNTSSKVTYMVENEDSFVTIGEKLCGDDEAWLSIVETNKILYPYIIHPGETYIITCN